MIFNYQVETSGLRVESGGLEDMSLCRRAARQVVRILVIGFIPGYKLVSMVMLTGYANDLGNACHVGLSYHVIGTGDHAAPKSPSTDNAFLESCTTEHVLELPCVSPSTDKLFVFIEPSLILPFS